jgi:hypothetical protein
VQRATCSLKETVERTNYNLKTVHQCKQMERFCESPTVRDG